MAIEDFLEGIKKDFGKAFKSKDKESPVLDLKPVSQQLPPHGLIIDNPLMEFALDRRFLAWGRCYLSYAKKGNGKTTMLFDAMKIVQKAGGLAFWIETENAPDFDYMRYQGVDPDKVQYFNPKTLEEATTVCLNIAENLPKLGDIPILIGLDSIAGAAPNYEKEQDVVGQTKVGEHAKLMAAFYRQLTSLIEPYNCIFWATNQLRDVIGQMTFGEEKGEALIGGEAQRFCSTYQFKLARIRDNVMKNQYGAERKIGSTHKIQVKRNKLGREGKGQELEFDIYIRGGIDWYSPLVRKLADDYDDIIYKNGGWHQWTTPGTPYMWTDPQTGVTEEREIDTEQKFRESDLGLVLYNSQPAKEIIRKAFEIPDLPDLQTIQAIEHENKKKRGRKPSKTDETNPVGVKQL